MNPEDSTVTEMDRFSDFDEAPTAPVAPFGGHGYGSGDDSAPYGPEASGLELEKASAPDGAPEYTVRAAFPLVPKGLEIEASDVPEDEVAAVAWRLIEIAHEV